MYVWDNGVHRNSSQLRLQVVDGRLINKGSKLNRGQARWHQKQRGRQKWHGAERKTIWMSRTNEKGEKDRERPRLADAWEPIGRVITGGRYDTDAHSPKTTEKEVIQKRWGEKLKGWERRTRPQGQMRRLKKAQNCETEKYMEESDGKPRRRKWTHCGMWIVRKGSGKLISYKQAKKENNEKSHTMAIDSKVKIRWRKVALQTPLYISLVRLHEQERANPHSFDMRGGKVKKSKNKGILFICIPKWVNMDRGT